MSKIYIFSSLGVDKRVFDKINFKNLDVEFIDWIEPLNNESFEAYANRIAEKLIASNPVLIGPSFGGMLTVEISKIIKARQLILIASAKNRFELPEIYQLFGKLKMKPIRSF